MVRVCYFSLLRPIPCTYLRVQLLHSHRAAHTDTHDTTVSSPTFARSRKISLLRAAAAKERENSSQKAYPHTSSGYRYALGPIDIMLADHRQQRWAINFPGFIFGYIFILRRPRRTDGFTPENTRPDPRHIDSTDNHSTDYFRASWSRLSTLSVLVIVTLIAYNFIRYIRAQHRDTKLEAAIHPTTQTFPKQGMCRALPPTPTALRLIPYESTRIIKLSANELTLSFLLLSAFFG